jgi:hypothetical protein
VDGVTIDGAAEERHELDQAVPVVEKQAAEGLELSGTEPSEHEAGAA